MIKLVIYESYFAVVKNRHNETWQWVFVASQTF